MKYVRNEVFPKSGRVKNFGYFASEDGLVQGRCSEGKEFVKNYEDICRDAKENESIWIQKLRSLGIKGAHQDGGWHNREKNYFELSYPYFNDGVKTGDMFALGEPESFVVVTVSTTSGIWSKKYHYKSTIH